MIYLVFSVSKKARQNVLKMQELKKGPSLWPQLQKNRGFYLFHYISSLGGTRLRPKQLCFVMQGMESGTFPA